MPASIPSITRRSTRASAPGTTFALSAAHVEIMADLIVNHISDRSPQFLDFQQRGEDSPFAGMFLTLGRVFPEGVRESDLLRIYRPRPGLPFTKTRLANGSEHLLWTTFTSGQIDIDVRHPAGRHYLTRILDQFQDAGIRVIRLDAVGYAIKKPGTSCFMIPETFDFIAELKDAGQCPQNRSAGRNPRALSGTDRNRKAVRLGLRLRAAAACPAHAVPARRRAISNAGSKSARATRSRCSIRTMESACSMSARPETKRTNCPACFRPNKSTP